MKKLGFLLLFALFAIFSLDASTGAKVNADIANKDSIYQATTHAQAVDSVQEQKLASEQIYEREKNDSDSNNTSEILNRLVAILVPMMAFLTAILIVFFVLRNKRIKELRMIQLYEKALDAGKDLPESFFRRPEQEPKSHLLKGMIWMGSGLGITIGAFYMMGEHTPWAFGLIPFFIGLAYLISYFIEKKDKANSAKDE